MKKLFLIISVVAILSSCSSKVLYQSSTGFVNYSAYARNGFFLTESNSVSFDYTPIGSVTATVLSGYLKTKSVTWDKGDGIYPSTPSTSKYKWQYASVDDAVAALVNIAIEQGANGIINLKIERYDGYDENNARREGLLISGMAIRK